MRLDTFLLVDLEVEVLRAVLLDLAMGCWGCGPRSMVVVEGGDGISFVNKVIPILLLRKLYPCNNFVLVIQN